MNYFNIAEIKISYSTKVSPKDRPQIKSSRSAAEIFAEAFKDTVEHHESMYALLLNRANKVLGIKQISVGGLSGCVADPKIIFQTALVANASGIILCHNHPSGNMQPSEADKRLTRKIADIGELMEITLLDHLIIGPDEDYFSFLDEGLM